MNLSGIFQIQFAFFGIAINDDPYSVRCFPNPTTHCRSFGRDRYGYGFENQSAVRSDDNALTVVDKGDFPLSKSSPFRLRLDEIRR